MDASLCAQAIARLATIDTDAHRDVGDALGRILDGLQLHPGDDGHLHWQVRVALPTDTGAALLGPITGSVPVVARKIAAPQSRLLTPQRVATALDLLATGASVDDLLQAVPGWGTARLLTAIPQALENKGLPRKQAMCMLASPITELRAAIVAALLHHPNPTPSDLPQLAQAIAEDPAHAPYIEHVLTCYLFPSHLTYARAWAYAIGPRQQLLDHIVARGGTATFAELTPIAPTLMRRELNTLLTEDLTTDGRPTHPCAQLGPHTQRNHRRSLSDDSQVSAITCPHCGGWASRVIHAPEIPRGLLCPTCHRAPTPNSPQFPNSYLDLPPITTTPPVPWDRQQPSRLITERETAINDQERAQIERTCNTCNEAFLPSTGIQRRCKPCSRIARGGKVQRKLAG